MKNKFENPFMIAALVAVSLGDYCGGLCRESK
jgi:hypothetical protein